MLMRSNEIKRTWAKCCFPLSPVPAPYWTLPSSEAPLQRGALCSSGYCSRRSKGLPSIFAGAESWALFVCLWSSMELVIYASMSCTNWNRAIHFGTNSLRMLSCLTKWRQDGRLFVFLSSLFTVNFSPSDTLRGLTISGRTRSSPVTSPFSLSTWTLSPLKCSRILAEKATKKGTIALQLLVWSHQKGSCP